MKAIYEKLSINGYCVNLILAIWRDEECKVGNIRKAQKIQAALDKRVSRHGKIPVRYIKSRAKNTRFPAPLHSLLSALIINIKGSLKMEYTRPHEFEKLLILHPALTAMCGSIKKDIETFNNSSLDNIESLALQHRPYDTIGHSKGSIADPTARIAMNGTNSQETQEELKGLISELLTLETVIEKINISLNVLPELQKEIITFRYLKGLNWLQIAERLLISESTAKMKRKQAIEKANTVSRISLKQYSEVIQLFN